jgi:hypothetical protein
MRAQPCTHRPNSLRAHGEVADSCIEQLSANALLAMSSLDSQGLNEHQLGVFFDVFQELIAEASAGDRLV